MSVKVVIICDTCGSQMFGKNYSSTWRKAKSAGWFAIGSGGKKKHLCKRCMDRLKAVRVASLDS